MSEKLGFVHFIYTYISFVVPHRLVTNEDLQETKLQKVSLRIVPFFASSFG